MATISSTGIGSGLDVNSIVTQLVALEKQPLKNLALQATTVTNQISAVAQITSQISALVDVADRLKSTSAWTARKASSSNASAATISVTSAAAATSFSLDVDALAKKQSVSSIQIAAGTAVGAGKLTFSLGTWSGMADSVTADAAPAAIATAAAARTAAAAAMSKANAVGTALSTFAGSASSPKKDYADAYNVWVAAVAANDHLTPALISGESTALGLRNTAYASLGTDTDAVNNLTAAAASAPALAALAAGTPSVATYSSKYSAWVSALAASDHVSGSSSTLAEIAALAARDAAHTALGLADPAAQLLADNLLVPVATSDSTDAVTVAVNSATAAAAVAAAATAVPRPSFVAAGSSSFSVDVSASDTVATLAAKINAANTGVVATPFNDGTFDRLLLSSKNTGVAAGFRVQVTGSTDGTNFDNTGLSRLAFDPHVGAFGMASAGEGLSVQEGANATARINGLTVTSATNTLTGNLPGVTINLVAPTITTSQVTMSISEDVTPGVKNVEDFMKAYNDLNATLTDLTKYDTATKTGSLFQGDSAVVGLQNMLRSMVGSISSGGTYQRLSDVGIERKLDGSLTNSNTTIKSGASSNAEKFTTAAASNGGMDLMNLFTGSSGFAVKFAALGKGLMASKDKALSDAKTRNDLAQTKVNDRAAAVEARLRKQYTALDTKMASLTALNAYVAQQVTTWNKSTA